MEAVEVDDSSDDEQIEILLQSLGKLLTKKRRVQGQTSTSSIIIPIKKIIFFTEDIESFDEAKTSIFDTSSFIEASLSTM